MAYSSRSPHVVGAHFYAKYGYDEAVRHISSNLSTPKEVQEHVFWSSVLDIIDELYEDEMHCRHPCAALKPKVVRTEIEEMPAAIAQRP
jgi:hypothetical protein